MFDADSRLLVTQWAIDKTSFPGVWTNPVCGHPAPGESLRDAIRRRPSFELGLGVEQARLVLSAVAYRAKAGGPVENEMCPGSVGLLPLGADVSVELHGDEVEAASGCRGHGSGTR